MGRWANLQNMLVGGKTDVLEMGNVRHSGHCRQADFIRTNSYQKNIQVPLFHPVTFTFFVQPVSFSGPWTEFLFPCSLYFSLVFLSSLVYLHTIFVLTTSYYKSLTQIFLLNCVFDWNIPLHAQQSPLGCLNNTSTMKKWSWSSHILPKLLVLSSPTCFSMSELTKLFSPLQTLKSLLIPFPHTHLMWKIIRKSY